MDILITDIKLYQSLPKKHRHIFTSTKDDYYGKYDNIINLFDKLTEKSINELVCAIQEKQLSGCSNKEIINKYDAEWYGLVKYIADHQKCQPKIIAEKDQNKIIAQKTKFKWTQNQILGWTNAVNNNFASGIHSQATGTGKSLMALKIIWEYHKKNPKNHVMWLCERKDIPQKLFFNIIDDEILFNETNFSYWREHDIINMYEFDIREYVYQKNDPNWMDKLDSLKYPKPLFIIINRAYLTAGSKYDDCTYKYEELQNTSEFVVLDECHSAMATKTYTLLLYVKYNWEAKVQGLSATPYRKENLTLQSILI